MGIKKEGFGSEKYIKWFTELNKNSFDIVGEKASYLAEAYNHETLSKRVKIPAGFVITKNAVEEFFKQNKIDSFIQEVSGKINANNLYELENISQKIKSFILRSEIPEKMIEEIFEAYETLDLKEIDMKKGFAKDILSTASEPIFVAVRNSYIDESGDSYFNIKGNSNLIDAIKKCIASLFETEVLLKEIKRGTSPENIRTSIIIQKMIQGEKSGVLFGKNKTKINAIWGLGAGLKLNEIGKDEYIVRRDSKVLEKKINEKKYAVTRDSSGLLKIIQLKEGYSFAQVLNESELQELNDIELRFEGIFNEKLQFDFTIENNEIFIVKIEPLKEKDTEITEEEKIIEIKNEPEKTINVLPQKTITKTKIKLLLESEKDFKNAISAGIKKIGIIKIEDIIKKNKLHPQAYIDEYDTKGYEEILYSELKKLENNFEEIWVSLSDFSNEDFENLTQAPKIAEKNPLMGLFGIRYLLTKPELLKREINAINRIQGKEVGILIPKISSLYELKKVKEYLKDTNLKIGIILEIPASMQLIKDFIDEGVENVIFSGDNLTQYILAIDKENQYVKEFYDDTNPALIYQIEYVIRVCKRNNIKTSFFGEALNKKEMLEFLIKKEIDSVILKPEKVFPISEEIAKIEEDIIKGTDKEIRKYEFNKEKERQNKELNYFEKKKEIEIKREITDLISKNTEKLEEQIESEELVNDEVLEDFGEIEKTSKIQELKENPFEKFDDEIENYTDEENEEDIEH